MKKVSILDLRTSDAWNYDWILVEGVLTFDNNIADIAYKDSKGDYVMMDGTKGEVQELYSRYCKEHNLELVDYDNLT